MPDPYSQIKGPVAWLPAGLISWYAPGGEPLVLVTSWFALVGGGKPRLRTAWPGRYDPESRFWAGGDFVLNIPDESGLEAIRKVMGQGKLCVNAETELGYSCLSGLVAMAPRLLESVVQLECVSGCLIDNGFDMELSGKVVRLHRENVALDPVTIPDLCAIRPLSP